MKYTLAVTSCNRHGLLKKTLESFIRTADLPAHETIIVEDSDAPRPAWLGTYSPVLGKIRWISNGRRRGQIFSLDTLYSAITTELVFHTEDDWLYEGGARFVAQSFALLDEFPNVWSVSLRGTDCNGHPVVTIPERFPFPINQPGWRGGWGGCHFNPGARRMSDYRRIGSYGRHVGYGQHGCGHELELSKMHLAMGFVIAAMPRCISHLGNGASRAVEPLAPQPRVLIAVPAAQQYEYGTHTLPVKRQTEGRINAVRETWARDAAVFPNVDVRFFYGQPVQDWSGDEVFLNCPDDYAGLAHKVKEVCRYALAQGYDFLVKTDDDTVLYIDRLLRSGFDRVDQMGYFQCGHVPGRPCFCYATGMCYTLSRRAMELVVAAPVTHWAEDLSVGNALRGGGIRPVGHSGWVPGFAAHYVKFPLPPATVAAHAVTPTDMLHWYQGLDCSSGPIVDAARALLNDTPQGGTSCNTYLEDPSAWL